MTRLYNTDVADDFVRQDARQTDPNAFACLHDINRTNANINKLLASRIRRTVFAVHCYDQGAATQDWIDAEGIAPASLNGGEILVDCPIWVSEHTRELVFNVRAARTGSNDHYLYPVVLPFGSGQGQVNPAEKVTVNQATAGGAPFMTATNDFTVDVSLGHLMSNTLSQEGFKLFRFVLLHEGSTSTSGKGVGANNITSVGSNWFQIDAVSTGNIGDVVVVTSNAQIEPRTIINEIAMSGGTRYTIDRPWNIQPSTSDTWDIYAVRTTQIESIALYEKEWTGAMFDLNGAV